MRIRESRLRALAWLACAALWALPATTHAQIAGCVPDLSGAVYVQVNTNMGLMTLELYPNTAPNTVQNFLNYMNDGDYDNVVFHRSVPGFVIQTGGFRDVGPIYAGIPTDPPIANEPCLSNTRGTIAMARLGGQPDSATSQWFVNLVDNLFLDSTDGVGFTAFGRVIDASLPVADAIAALPIFDAILTLQLPVNQVFSDFPLMSLPVDPPGGYGCVRETPLFGLTNDTFTAFIEDTTRSLPGSFVPILLDPICTGAGATGPPTVPCDPANGRLVAQLGIVGPPPINMSCDAVAEAEDSWAARRAGTQTQMQDDDVEIISLPEPGRAWLLLAGGVLVFAMARRRR
ncbi:MAG: peptidylprolyl isomerase [Myxococcota bacterium]